MIDAVSLCGSVADPGRVADRLDRARVTTGEPGTLPVVSGYVGTLRATIMADRLRLRGSLPEYIGAPTTLGRGDVERASCRLADALGENLCDLSVWRLELSADLTLSRPVAAYLPLLIRRARLQRVEYQGESVAFDAAVRRLVFYDKAAERRKRKEPAPSGNVLRFEVQFRKRLRSQLGAAEGVTFGDLHDSAFFAHLARRWAQEYESVEKGRAPLPFEALADVRLGLTLAGLSVVGRPGVEASIRAAHESGDLRRSTMYDRLKWVRDLSADPDLTREDDRIAELDAAVRNATDAALSGP